MSSPPYVILKLLKPHLTSQRKIPMLKHGHIRNQHTHISDKKNIRKISKINFPCTPPYHLFSVTKTTHNYPSGSAHALIRT